MDLHGKTAIITGAASGIGAETAKAMAECGATLILLDINGKGLEEQKEKLKEFKVDVCTFTVDITDYEAVQNVGKEVYEVCERIDILANIAGGGNPESTLPIFELSKTGWDKLINLNLGTMFNCTKMVLPKMMEQRSGKIINMSSVAGVRGGPVFGKGGYATAKGGVNAFTQTLARELGPYGIYVNAIAPGLILTPGHNDKPTEAMQAFVNSFPLRKMGDASNIAKLVVFLASDHNQFITGDIICVDGGLCMH